MDDSTTGVELIRVLAMGNLGLVLFSEGNFHDALGAFERSLPVLEQLFGTDSLEIATQLNNEAAALTH